MEWNRTKLIENRLESILKNGLYQGRHLIRRDSPIDGGVYLGGGRREAIVVNSQNSSLIEYVYAKAKKMVDSAKKSPLEDPLKEDPAKENPLEENLSAKENPEKFILMTTYNIVRDYLTYSEKEVDKIILKHNAYEDKKISLGVFIGEGYGVCRHQALLAGFLLERFIKEGYLQGKVSIDRNSLLSAHAWCRYTSEDGKVTIIDPAQGFFGSLEKSLEKLSWEYHRKEDEKEERER
ncbi:MAG: hypothetical protein KKD75_02880, partial [Nanoarchaeota archaeon]|nr:hypothetical protein [Nanoarchaeota archaeon]MBU1632596.1 hypothetical protein [Nanoarchaeota archaeon]